ncbi:hypothetical protein WA158_002466 [Blastocystis sp. Blastoise]
MSIRTFVIPLFCAYLVLNVYQLCLYSIRASYGPSDKVDLNTRFSQTLYSLPKISNSSILYSIVPSEESFNKAYSFLKSFSFESPENNDVVDDIHPRYLRSQLYATYEEDFLTESHYLFVYGTTMIDTNDKNRQTIQENTLKSFNLFKQNYNCEFVIFTDSESIINMVEAYNLTYSTQFKSNRYNVPYFHSMMKYLETHYDSDFYGYVNGDILQESVLFDILQQTLVNIEQHKLHKRVLLIGRRYNIKITSIDLSSSLTDLDAYDEYLRLITRDVNPHSPNCMDYFIFTRHTFNYNEMSKIVIGRNYVDSYIFKYAVSKPDVISVIDITNTQIAVHQSDADKHKLKQNRFDYDYNFFIYIFHYPFQKLSRTDMAPLQYVHCEDNEYNLCLAHQQL